MTLQRMTRALWALAFCLLGSCASQTRLPEPVRVAIQTKHAGSVVELRQSCYFGELYDENELWLLAPHPFASTSHIDDTDGNPIHPHNQRGIVPAGTKLVVDHIEFPDSWAMARRMLTTPRYNPWVYLRATPNDPHIPAGAKPFVWVLPPDMDTQAAVETAIGQVVAPDGEVSAWLQTVRPTVRVAIENKDITVGMAIKELTAAMGDPMHRFNDTRDGQHVDVDWFPEHEAWLSKDIVVDIKPSRKLVSSDSGGAGGAAETLPPGR